MSELTDPEILEFVRVSEDSYPIDANVASPEEDRRLYRLMFALFELPRPDDVASGDTFIAAAGPTRQIPPPVLLIGTSRLPIRGNSLPPRRRICCRRFGEP